MWNIVDLIYIYFIATIVILAVCINVSEDNLPTVLLQTFRYGKHAYKGSPSRLVSSFEIPKSYFKHFYVFAIVWAISIFYLVLSVYVLGTRVPEWIIDALDLLCGSNRVANISSWSAMFAVTLLTFQCARRFYETQYIQVFSRQSKINFTHYIVGYYHYFGAFLTIISQAPGFNRNPQPGDEPYLNVDSLYPYHLSMTLLFCYAWYQQCRANIMLANLRKNHKGTVVTERHLMPVGGYFDAVSAPHMLFEVLMYTFLTIILIGNTSWPFVFIWVVANQIENAWLCHKWYLETFKDYPKDRRAIFPALL